MFINPVFKASCSTFPQPCIAYVNNLSIRPKVPIPWTSGLAAQPSFLTTIYPFPCKLDKQVSYHHRKSGKVYRCFVDPVHYRPDRLLFCCHDILYRTYIWFPFCYSRRSFYHLPAPIQEESCRCSLGPPYPAKISASSPRPARRSVLWNYPRLSRSDAPGVAVRRQSQYCPPSLPIL